MHQSVHTNIKAFDAVVRQIQEEQAVQMLQVLYCVDSVPCQREELKVGETLEVLYGSDAILLQVDISQPWPQQLQAVNLTNVLPIQSQVCDFVQ